MIERTQLERIRENVDTFIAREGKPKLIRDYQVNSKIKEILERSETWKNDLLTNPHFREAEKFTNGTFEIMNLWKFVSFMTVQPFEAKDRWYHKLGLCWNDEKVWNNGVQPPLINALAFTTYFPLIEEAKAKNIDLEIDYGVKKVVERIPLELRDFDVRKYVRGELRWGPEPNLIQFRQYK